jgi:hypothetical protein
MTAMSAEAPTNAEQAYAELPTAPSAPRAVYRPRRDSSRSRAEAFIALREPVLEEDPVGALPTPSRGTRSRAFSLLEVTAGLPEDSRDDDQRARAQVEAQRRGRVAAARAVLQAHPEASALVMRDQTHLRMFCARYGVTPQDLCPHAEDPSAWVVAPGTPRDRQCSWCHSWHRWTPIHVEDATEVLASPCDYIAEVRAREAACLPTFES